MRDAAFGTKEAGQIKALIIKEPAVDGIFALGDMIAAGYIHMMLQDPVLHSARLPLVGFDGLDISRLFEFSTVAQPIREMGEQAVELLLSRIKGLSVPGTKLAVSYIERKSTIGAFAWQKGD